MPIMHPLIFPTQAILILIYCVEQASSIYVKNGAPRKSPSQWKPGVLSGVKYIIMKTSFLLFDLLRCNCGRDNKNLQIEDHREAEFRRRIWKTEKINWVGGMAYYQ